MKSANVLTVLMYLFKHHFKGEKNPAPEEQLSEEQLIDQLKSAGFALSSIESAMNWLSKLTPPETLMIEPLRSSASSRVLSNEERQILDTDCQNYLLFLQNQLILSPLGMELVIRQLLDLKSKVIDANLIQWVTLMYLYNQENPGEALAKMELLILQEHGDILH
jgi:Smg protein